jgi:hypothetical protein
MKHQYVFDVEKLRSFATAFNLKTTDNGFPK